MTIMTVMTVFQGASRSHRREFFSVLFVLADCVSKQGKGGHTLTLASNACAGTPCFFASASRAGFMNYWKSPRRLPAADRKNLLVRCPKPRLKFQIPSESCAMKHC